MGIKRAGFRGYFQGVYNRRVRPEDQYLSAMVYDPRKPLSFHPSLSANLSRRGQSKPDEPPE
jgi:hypothetical protein